MLNGHRPNQSEPAHPALFIDGKLIQEFEVDATDLEGQIVECRTRVTAGEHLLSATYLRNYHGLPPSYQRARAFQTAARAADQSARPSLPRRTSRRCANTAPGSKPTPSKPASTTGLNRSMLAVLSIRSTGPSPESIRRIYVCGHAPGKHTDACARTILTNFASRAFRRPATAREVEAVSRIRLPCPQAGRFLRGGNRHRAPGGPGVAELSVSHRTGPPAAPGRTPVPVSPYELAARLSYFLWSSMPDAELLRAAGQGTLRQPAVLKRR